MTSDNRRKEAFWVRMAGNILTPVHYDEEKAWKRVQRRTGGMNKRLHIGWLKYAAVFAAGVGMSLWGYVALREHPLQGPASTVVSFYPANRQAELVLATGHRLLLNDSIRGHQVEEAGMKIWVGEKEQRLQYNHAETVDGTKIIGYNTLRVPKGGEYILVLPDSSEVHLNSESSIRFPVSFASDKREVFLEGEAFFKVKPDSRAPFHVLAAGRDICVLGTTFNVFAYSDDPCFRSTLVSGKVKITGGKQEVVLKPFEQYAENQETGTIDVLKVDPAFYLSWMDGKIMFKGERLEDIVKKLARWFDFEIFYANEEAKDMKFRGVIRKYDSFESVLKTLEKTTPDISFFINGHTVIVRKNSNN